MVPTEKRIYEVKSWSIGPECEVICRSLCSDEEIGIRSFLRAVLSRLPSQLCNFKLLFKFKAHR